MATQQQPKHFFSIISSLLVSLLFLKQSNGEIIIAVQGTDNAGFSTWKFCGCCTFEERSYLGGRDADGVSSAADTWMMDNILWASDIEEAFEVPIGDSNTGKVRWTLNDPDLVCSNFNNSYIDENGKANVISNIAVIEMGHPPELPNEEEDKRGEFGLATDIPGHMVIEPGDKICMSGEAVFPVDTYRLRNSNSDTLGGCEIDFRTNEGGCEDATGWPTPGPSDLPTNPPTNPPTSEANSNKNGNSNK